MPSENDVRVPNEEEILALSEFLANSMCENPADDDKKTAESSIRGASIAVFDKYTTDGPGYSGKLISITYSGSESFYENFIEREGKLAKVSTEIK